MSRRALDRYQRHRLTVHDFRRRGEAGILPVEGRLELIEGEIIAMAPIGSRHAAIVTRANVRAGSGGLRHRLDFVGKFHKNEIVRWIEIILPFVIKHARSMI